MYTKKVFKGIITRTFFSIALNMLHFILYAEEVTKLTNIQNISILKKYFSGWHYDYILFI